MELIEKGFDAFKGEFGRYPTGPEINTYPHLPSCKQLERRFGGLVELRQLLGHEITNFSAGESRSKIAASVGYRGRVAENDLEKILIKRFGLPFVHTERRFSQENKNRIDFYIFSPSGNFGVDIFYTETARSLWGNIDHKLGRYKDFPREDTLIFACANSAFSQKEIDQIISRHPNKVIRDHVFALETLLKWVGDRGMYQIK
jgi:hypothetical protein